MRRAMMVFWRVARAYLFYPVMIGLFIWLFVTGAHWVFGLAVIIAILVLDPIWRVMAGNALRLWRSRK